MTFPLDLTDEELEQLKKTALDPELGDPNQEIEAPKSHADETAMPAMDLSKPAEAPKAIPPDVHDYLKGFVAKHASKGPDQELGAAQDAARKKTALANFGETFDTLGHRPNNLANYAIQLAGAQPERPQADHSFWQGMRADADQPVRDLLMKRGQELQAQQRARAEAEFQEQNDPTSDTANGLRSVARQIGISDPSLEKLSAKSIAQAYPMLKDVSDQRKEELKLKGAQAKEAQATADLKGVLTQNYKTQLEARAAEQGTDPETLLAGITTKEAAEKMIASLEKAADRESAEKVTRENMAIQQGFTHHEHELDRQHSDKKTEEQNQRMDTEKYGKEVEPAESASKLIAEAKALRAKGVDVPKVTAALDEAAEHGHSTAAGVGAALMRGGLSTDERRLYDLSKQIPLAVMQSRTASGKQPAVVEYNASRNGVLDPTAKNASFDEQLRGVEKEINSRRTDIDRRFKPEVRSAWRGNAGQASEEPQTAQAKPSGPVQMKFPDGSVHSVDPQDIELAHRKGGVEVK